MSPKVRLLSTVKFSYRSCEIKIKPMLSQKLKLILFGYVLSFCSISLKAQTFNVVEGRYQKAFDTLSVIIKQNGSFKQAAFLTENCFLNNEMSARNFYKHISLLSSMAEAWRTANPLIDYRYNDSTNFHLNLAIFKLLKDTLTIVDSQNKSYRFGPYSYDFEDFFGVKDWTNMFVTKLISTQKGNCHSLPFLYKILADELGATCWLSFAPNHIYIKNRCQKAGWYNTELTSGTFPVDAWIATSGYVPIEAIRNGIYMDTLSNQQAIAQCVLDLAKGYEFKTKNYQDGFILKCCDLVLQYHSVNVQALLLKAETLKQIFEKTKEPTVYKEMEILYILLLELGYREMPERMYMQWLRSATEQSGKFDNKKL